ncbi:MAG: pantetheine-phosphate adenylyltransferase [Pseudomonadota bacterium]
MSAHRELVGLYPGTFDPITKGHLDIIARATRVVDRLVIAVASNAEKAPLFSTEERVELVKGDVLALQQNGIEIEVRPFGNLLMHLAEEVGARVIIRGLRAVSDFEYEFQMASMNARLNGEVETLFLTASERQQFIASRFVKEIGRLGGDISSFVSPAVAERLVARLAEQDAG